MAKKLFEVLVVEGQLKGQAEKLRGEIRTTFEKKRHLFEEKRVTFQSSDEGAIAVVEQQSDIQSTVRKELDWLATMWAKAIDTSYAVAEGNTMARSDVVLDSGTILLKGVPATALLELEKRAAELQDVLIAVPTLDPAKGFKPDSDKGHHISRARDVQKARTKKIEDFVVIVPATKEHPAQVAKVNKDITVGTIQEQEWSALLTPVEKADLITRAEEVRRAVKAALHRANAQAQVDVVPVGQKLFDYVLKG